MKTILFGNGLNLLNGYSTWEDLLVKIAAKDGEERIPNTIQYEAGVLPLPEKDPTVFTYHDKRLIYNGKVLTFTMNAETNFKAKIADEMVKYETNDVYEHIANLRDVTHFVTTNYDEVMKHTLELMGYKVTGYVRTENTYSLRRCIMLQNDQGDQKQIWNIHGEIASPKTIMLGLNQYCGSVGKINDYLIGKYTYSLNKEEQTLPSIRQRLGDGINVPFSWIDLFFNSVVFILGFGLLYEEIDLWWILTRRKRLLRQGVELNNHVFYCGHVPSGKRQLLKTMDVEIIEPDAHAKDYREQYHSMIDKIEAIA